MSKAHDTAKHAGRIEWWIEARARVNAGAPRGRHGIYRATVTRPHCTTEPRVRAMVRRVQRALTGAFPAGIHAGHASA